nr:uncharacterized protein LOC129060988 isoform X3 [Pongo abelii]
MPQCARTERSFCTLLLPGAQQSLGVRPTLSTAGATASAVAPKPRLPGARLKNASSPPSPGADPEHARRVPRGTPGSAHQGASRAQHPDDITLLPGFFIKRKLWHISYSWAQNPYDVTLLPVLEPPKDEKPEYKQ